MNRGSTKKSMKNIEGVPIHSKGFLKLFVLKNNLTYKESIPLPTLYIDPKLMSFPPKCWHSSCKNGQFVLILFSFGDTSMLFFP